MGPLSDMCAIWGVGVMCESTGTTAPERSGPPDSGVERESRTGLAGRTAAGRATVRASTGVDAIKPVTGLSRARHSTGCHQIQKARDGLARLVTGYWAIGGYPSIDTVSTGWAVMV
jgi:hypothetical protein